MTYTRRCEECVWYAAKSASPTAAQEGLGDCRHSPPDKTGWPTTRHDYWCGGFEPHYVTESQELGCASE